MSSLHKVRSPPFLHPPFLYLHPSFPYLHPLSPILALLISIVRTEPTMISPILIKLCSLRDDHLPAVGIIELPSLIASWIPNGDGLLHVRTNACPLIPLDMDIGSTPKHSQPGHLAFPHARGCREWKKGWRSRDTCSRHEGSCSQRLGEDTSVLGGCILARVTHPSGCIPRTDTARMRCRGRSLL